MGSLDISTNDIEVGVFFCRTLKARAMLNQLFAAFLHHISTSTLLIWGVHWLKDGLSCRFSLLSS